MTEKADDAFRTISEAADVLDLPAHSLRHWETLFGAIKPMRRSGGRRYYRPRDIQLLAGIKKLIDADGFSITGVKKILRDQGVGHVIEIGQSALNGTVASDTPTVNIPLSELVAITDDLRHLKAEIRRMRNQFQSPE